MRFITASRLRHAGLTSFLIGLLALGIGVGLWGWEGGDL